LIQKVRSIDGDVALFGHGHILRAVTARWLGFEVKAAQAFALKTGTISILGYEHEWPTMVRWNAPA
jgi:probable phosphoglycerate mutase